MEQSRPNMRLGGKTLAKTKTVEALAAAAEIFTINAAGGVAFNVTDNDVFDSQPSYSPDGEKMR